MEKNWLERTELLIGPDALNKLANSHVLVVGLGGVGSFAAEFLARAGVGELTIVDGDTVDITNINRQLQALHSTVGLSKSELMEIRLKDINPNIKLTAYNAFQNPEDTIKLLSNTKFNYIADCIDSISPKVTLIKTAMDLKIPLISSMGAGGRISALDLKVADIDKTYNCKFARYVRKRLHRHNVYKGFKAVFSSEMQNTNSIKLTDGSNYKRSFYGTISYIPALFGITLAAEIIQDLAIKK